MEDPNQRNQGNHQEQDADNLIRLGLEGLAGSLLGAASIGMQRRDAVKDNHRMLSDFAKGNLFYSLASSIMRDLDEILMFPSPIPFPVPSDRIGFHHQELAILDKSSQAVMVFPERYGCDDTIEVDYSYGNSDYVHQSHLSRRLFDHEIVVQDYNSFFEFLMRAKKELREANPFIPMQKSPEAGDLVFCYQYAEIGHRVSSRQIRMLGNTLNPKDRLGVIQSINVLDKEMNILSYEITSNDGLRIVFYNYTDKCEGIREDFKRSRREHVDELHVVLADGWTNEYLERPFMSDQDAEGIIFPILARYAVDPRLYSAASEKQRLLGAQFALMIQKGIPVDSIVDTFHEDYGVSHRDILQLAGGTSTHLALLVAPELSAMSKPTSQYESMASELIDGALDLLGIPEAQLFSFSRPEPGDIQAMYERFPFRRVRATNYTGAVFEGYLEPAFHEYEEDGKTIYCGNIHADTTNFLHMDTVDMITAEFLPADSYRHPVNFDEVKYLVEFLNMQLALLFMPDSEGRYAGLSGGKPGKQPREVSEEGLDGEFDEDNFSDPADLAFEFLDNKLASFEAAVERKKDQRRKKPGSHDDDVTSPYWDFRLELDKRVVGPLLAYGFTIEEVRKQVSEVMPSHPFAMRAMAEIESYRNKDNNPFKKSPLAAHMLKEAMAMGEITFDNMHPIIAKYRDLAMKDEPGQMIYISEAINLLMARAFGAEVAPLEEMIDVSAGHRREYIDNGTVTSILGHFISAGAPTLEAAKNAVERKPLPRAGLVNIMDHRGDYYIETTTMLELDKLGLLLMDEIALMNASDPRNKDYFCQRAALPFEKRAKELAKLSRLYPSAGSNYFLVAEVAHDRDGSPLPSSIHLNAGNLNTKEFSVSYDEKPDIDEAIQKLREAGMPVIISGKHELTEKEGKYLLVPEFENLEDPRMFSLNSHIPDRYARDRRSHRRHSRHFHDEDSFAEYETHSSSIVHCHAQDFLGTEYALNLFRALKPRIEQMFGIGEQKLLAYANLVRENNAALPPPSVPLLGDK